jgi:signal transduction histidine kinase
LKNRLTLTYTLFMSLALLVLTGGVNLFTRIIFEDLVKETGVLRSAEIVRSITELYNPRTKGFDMPRVEALGMYFVHEGYIITLESPEGSLLWDARSMDMGHCVEVFSEITRRMEQNHQIHGSLQHKTYPILYQDNETGFLKIESYAPFFYTEGESRFLSSLNRLFCIAGVVFSFLSVLISLFLAGTIAGPILKASEAARSIAAGNRGVSLSENGKTRELNELSRSINILAQELAEGERRQKRLTMDIAHELRTPLTCLQGNLEAMIDGVWEATPDRLVSCHEEVIRLSNLSQDISLLTALEWENLVLHKTSFDLAVLLRLVTEQFQNAAFEKGVALIQSLPPSPVFADYDRLKQVFINVLANGLKYTDAGAVTVAVSPGGRENWWEITVADTGIGISAIDLPHIFERFYRSDKSRNRGTGGAGIGLTIAQAIVAAHSGTIAADSAPDTGSVFRIALPRDGGTSRTFP